MMRVRKQRQPIAEINVVPYIDVMLVLLVIFMITAPLLSQGVHIQLPQAKAKILKEKQQPLIISVDKAGAMYLNVSDDPKKAMTPLAMVTRVAAEVQLAKQQGQTKAVFIRGDNKANYGQVVQAMVLLQQAGVANIGLMTKPKAVA